MDVKITRFFFSKQCWAISTGSFMMKYWHSQGIRYRHFWHFQIEKNFQDFYVTATL